MKKILFLVLMILGAQTFAQEKTLKISTVKGAQAGIVCSKIIIEAYNRLGIDVEIIPLPGKTAIARANDGVMDAELFRINGIDKTFTNLIQVPIKINKDDAVVLSKDPSLQVSGWDSIKDYFIGIKRGVVFIQKGTQGMKVIELDSFDNIMKMLEDDRVNVVVNTQVNALNYLAKHPASNINIIYPPVQSVDLYHYIHKDHIELLEPLTKVLQDMQDNGEIAQIREDYISTLSNNIK